MTQFPRTTVAGVSLPRLLIGTNWMLGWSHRGHAADRGIRHAFREKEAFVPILKTFLDRGIDAVMAPFSTTPAAIEGILYAQDKLGKQLILIDTPIINVDDTPQARQEANAIIRKSAQIGSTFCLLHHSSCEQLVNKNLQQMPRLKDYLAMIRDAGLLPGLSAHMPEIIQYSDACGYDVETYIQIFNCLGFLMQVEVEQVVRIIHSAQKPVMAIKPMAAGRTTPYVGLTFNWHVLREQDMIAIGCQNEWEADEDIEISLAALENRLPSVLGRSSPAKEQSVLL